MSGLDNGHNNLDALSNSMENMAPSAQWLSKYTSGTIECIDYINACNFDYLEGNIVKYITRYKHKNGVVDLRKAEFYLRILIERELNGIGDET